MDAHLGVKLQPLRRDGGEGQPLSAPSHSSHDFLGPERLHGLSVHLQQQLSVLQPRPLRRTPALQLTQDVICPQGRVSGRPVPQEVPPSPHSPPSHVRPDAAFSSRRVKPKPAEPERSWRVLGAWGRPRGTAMEGRMGIPRWT